MVGLETPVDAQGTVTVFTVVYSLCFIVLAAEPHCLVYISFLWEVFFLESGIPFAFWQYHNLGDLTLYTALNIAPTSSHPSLPSILGDSTFHSAFCVWRTTDNQNVILHGLNVFILNWDDFNGGYFVNDSLPFYNICDSLADVSCLSRYKT